MDYDVIVVIGLIGAAESGESANGFLDLISADFFEGNVRKRSPVTPHYLKAHVPAAGINKDPHGIGAIWLQSLPIR